MKPHLVKMWYIPPRADAEFVWRMEDVLETYKLPYDPRFPVVCMDETSKQLVGEVRAPEEAEPGRVRRMDSEYERKGTCNLFMFFEPLRGWRRVWVTQQRRKVEWACCVKQLLQTHYPSAKKVVLVCDNLNTHTKGAFYTAFPPELARAYVKRINFCYTPKHGSWLNVAECELSCLTSQCLAGRRIGELPLLQAEIRIWAEKTKVKQRAVDWQFKIGDARTKLKRLYPRIKNG